MEIARKFRIGWLAIALLALAACSNGRGSLTEPEQGPVNELPPPTPPPTPPPDPPPNPPPAPPPAPPPSPPPAASAIAGYWQGTASDEDDDDDERSWTVVALVAPSGEAQWILLDDDRSDSGFVLHGNVCCESELDSELAGKRLGETRTEDGRLQVELDAGALRGEIRFRGDDFAFTLNASSAFNQPLTLAELAGTYTRSTVTLLGSQTTMTLTIDANGQLNGSHTNGCVFNGTASIPDATRSLVSLQVRLDSCGGTLASSKQWNGQYGGLGILLRDAVSPSNPQLREDVFYHSTVGPAWLGPQPVGK